MWLLLYACTDAKRVKEPVALTQREPLAKGAEQPGQTNGNALLSNMIHLYTRIYIHVYLT